MTALVVGVAWLLGFDLWQGLLGAVAVNFAAFWFSDRMALRAAKAKPVSEREMPEVYAIVRELTEKQGMPMPGIYRIKTKQANAFATGRSPRKAAVAVTDGIMDLLNERELRGVLGHEISHVKNRDILISSVSAVLAAALSFFVSRAAFSDKKNSAWLIPAVVFTPIASAILRSGISKTREFEADHDGGTVTEDPLSLASALEGIENSARTFPLRLNAAIGGLFISDPLLGFGGARRMLSVLSTHPPTEERVARLEAQARDRGWDQAPPTDDKPVGAADDKARRERPQVQQQTRRSDSGLFGNRRKRS
jgi:heat shock protein HtpX